MSTPSEKRQVKGGFNVVFRLRRQGRSALAKAPDGAASQLIANKLAQPVVTGRSALAADPILSGVYVMPAGSMGETQDVLDRLNQDEMVEKVFVAPPRDVLSDRTGAASKAAVREQTWRQQIKLPEAGQLAQWAINQKVTVAILDSGVDRTHPQLSHVSAADHLENPPRLADQSGHGTHVCGLVAANNSDNGFIGVADDCTEVCVHRGLVKPNDVAGYYRALRACIGARIINLSVGGEEEDEIETELIQLALEEPSTIVVAASGNHREFGDPTIYPAALPGVIAVAAVDGAGAVSTTSSSGPHVMLAAPGVEILSTAPTYRIADLRTSLTPPLAALSGTSMATPIVSGVIARMLAFKPSLTRAQVIDLITTKLNPDRNDDVGHGIVDAQALLAAL
jgi:subtilisin family serine protease